MLRRPTTAPTLPRTPVAHRVRIAIRTPKPTRVDNPIVAKVDAPLTPTAVPGGHAGDVGADAVAAAVQRAAMAPIPPMVESELRIQTKARTDPAATRARTMKTSQKAVRGLKGSNRVDSPSSRARTTPTTRVAVDRDVVAGVADVAVAVAVTPTPMAKTSRINRTHRTDRINRNVPKANRLRP